MSCVIQVFVFSRGNIQQIEKALVKMDKEMRKKYAQVNFERSANYAKNILDEKRDQFYYQFRDGK